jgi:hypothetical protein
VNHRLSLTIAAAALTATAGVPAFADDVITTHRLSAGLASEAVTEAVASCGRQGYNETVVLVDADGVRQAVLRGDHAGSHTLDSANDKAYTAATFKADTVYWWNGRRLGRVSPLCSPNFLISCCSAVASSSRWAMR